MHRFLFLALLCLVQLKARVLDRPSPPSIHDVLWDSSSDRFEPISNAIDSPGFAELSIKSTDILRLICARGDEVSVVYQVSREDFERCSLSSSSHQLARCSAASSFLVSLSRSRYSSDVYLISTSTGDQEGLFNKKFGLCLTKNLRLAIHFEADPKMAHDSEESTEIEDVEEQAASERLFLAEENGLLTWKKLVGEERRLKFAPAMKMGEAIPLKDDLVNQLRAQKAVSEFDPDLGFVEEEEEEEEEEPPTRLSASLVKQHSQ